MTQSEYKFHLVDRLQKIRQMYEEYDLEHKAYISFSGGKDSVVLSNLFDLAVPENKIPRVFINTGIDLKAITSYVKEFGREDERLVIIKPLQNISILLNKFGYPFKSKDHSQKVATYQKSGECKTVTDYLGRGNKKTFLCPSILKQCFTPSFKLKVSDECCKKLKKEPASKWSKENNRPIAITGIRKGEGGVRSSMKGCTVFSNDNSAELKKFHPLFPVGNDFIDMHIKVQGLRLCEVYYAPYNFSRTGCVGCPFTLKLQDQLDILEKLMPDEKKKAEIIWKPVYKEYRKIGYRLRKDDNQLNLF